MLGAGCSSGCWAQQLPVPSPGALGRGNPSPPASFSSSWPNQAHTFRPCPPPTPQSAGPGPQPSLLGWAEPLGSAPRPRARASTSPGTPCPDPQGVRSLLWEGSAGSVSRRNTAGVLVLQQRALGLSWGVGARGIITGAGI